MLVVLVVLFQSVYSSTCKQFQPRKDNLNIALIGHSVMDINETNHHECAKTCMSLKICKSIDYDRTKKACKLNDIDRSSVDQLEFKTKKASIFSDISEWPSVSLSLFFRRRVFQQCSKTNKRIEIQNHTIYWHVKKMLLLFWYQ